ncbi:MAG TPA: carbamoyl-phosphate synthase large subunit [bacterium]|nr:carbamoyl-phosphate synthase large subunit [bacterium]
MPKRTDIQKIMIIGSGPIIIGQACEFDYSGTQACRALKEEGYTVILVNSNPATIMTDPEFADRTYIEPMTPEMVAKIVEKERPDALLPTLGGQTGLNTAVALAESGVLEKYGVELIGAKLPAIKKAEDRKLFKEAMQKIGLELPQSGFATTLAEALGILKQVGFPAIIRPSFTMGGTGGGIARDRKEFVDIVSRGLAASPVSQVLIEESVLGWKEYELEVMRDRKDNVVIICSIENLDPMGVHTGDSITVAPQQTLTDKEYQVMRDAAIRVIREIGVDTGGSNIQFGVNPKDGRMVVIEMNPRVSRSSALASKATGFPIAKIATKLAVGYTLDEILNDITRSTPASFEPTIDYVVTKIPRFTFEKFKQAEPVLTTQMKSVGEAKAIGRTFQESLQKAIRSLEIGRYGLTLIEGEAPAARPTEGATRAPMMTKKALLKHIETPRPERIFYVAEAFRRRCSVAEVFKATKIDPWFLTHIRDIVSFEGKLKAGRGRVTAPLLAEAKRRGFSDSRLADLWKMDEKSVRKLRKINKIIPVYKIVDTCAAEFKAYTPYLYSTYETEDEAAVTKRKKIVILGGGPNRIGQGIEFDYCCVHASFALREDGYETIMVNCNPETVSTDYDVSDRLYFEPLTYEDVMNIVEAEKPDGVIVQFGGQTPLKLAVSLKKAGAPIIGTSPESINRAEDRELFAQMIRKLGLRQPRNGMARSVDEAVKVAESIGYPVLVRPSYVLGGRAMEIVYDSKGLKDYMDRERASLPVLVDQFLDGALEVDVDALADKDGTVFVAGILEHIEEAGIHSGDSAMSLPPRSLTADILAQVQDWSVRMAQELKVVGLMNVQFAVVYKEGVGDLYVLEVNPRASRTVPFVSKAVGSPLAKIASLLMVGHKLAEFPLQAPLSLPYVAIKESVFPFSKFAGVDTLLGPEMKSTGEVMGIADGFGEAFAKSQLAAGTNLPSSGTAFLSVRNEDKPAVLEAARRLLALGFKVVATKGTALFLREHGLNAVQAVNKVTEGSPHIVDRLEKGEIALVINTPEGRLSAMDSFSIRRTALMKNVPYFTTAAAAVAAVEGIETMMKRGLEVKAMQDYHQVVKDRHVANAGTH